MRMVIRSTGNVQVRKVYLTQFCDMKSIVALYCSSHSTRLDRWLSWWYPVYILLNLIHCFWTRTTQRVFPFNFYLCNCIYFHVQYPPCRKLWNCGKAPEFELWPALILKEESTKEEEEEDGKLEVDSRPKAEMLLEQFSSVFSTLKTNIMPHISRYIEESLENIEIDQKGTEKLLKNLNISKSSGPDNIRNAILKEYAAELAPVVTQ